MRRIRPRVSWVLVAVAVLLALFGVTDVLLGVTADPGISIGLTGLTPGDLAAQSPAGYRLFDIATRAGGLDLVVIGTLLTAILLIPYRQGQRWAWYAAWTLPLWCVCVLGMYLAFGIAPGQPPPPPMLSAPILGPITAAALLIDRRRFFARREDTPVRIQRDVTSWTSS